MWRGRGIRRRTNLLGSTTGEHNGLYFDVTHFSSDWHQSTTQAYTSLLIRYVDCMCQARLSATEHQTANQSCVCVCMQKKYEVKGENSFTIRRLCLPNCKERETNDGSYTQCCTGNLCNGFSSSYVVKDHRWLLLAAFIVSVLAALLT